jgi:hypothetical protein
MKVMKKLFGKGRRGSTEETDPSSGESSPAAEQLEISAPSDFKRSAIRCE